MTTRGIVHSALILLARLVVDLVTGLAGEHADRQVDSAHLFLPPPGESRQARSVLVEACFSYSSQTTVLSSGQAQFAVRRRLGRLAPLALACFERPTDAVFRRLR